MGKTDDFVFWNGVSLSNGSVFCDIWFCSRDKIGHLGIEKHSSEYRHVGFHGDSCDELRKIKKRVCRKKKLRKEIF